MSLVGTRPPTVDEWEQYELHHRSRMTGCLQSRYQRSVKFRRILSLA